MSSVPSLPPVDQPPVFLAGGEMGQRLRAHAWADSSLGPPQHWPQPLRTLVDLMLSATQPMFIVWGPERTLLYNDAYAEVLAIKHPTALGSDFLSVWHEIRADLVPIVNQAYAGEPVHMDDIELIMQRKGFVEETHFSFSYTPVRDESGQTAGFFCPCNDITGQVLAERRLRESEARARGVLDGMAESFALLGPDFTILDVNAETTRLDTRSREELVGLSHWEAYPGSKNSEIGLLYQRAMAERVPVSLLHSYGWKDGRQTWLDMRAFPTADGLAIFFSDVTERKVADAALQAAAERSMRDAAEREALLGQLGEGVIVTDAEGRITFVNDAAERLHGVKLLGITPEAYSETYHLLTEAGDPHPARELPLARAVLDREIVVDARWRIRRPDGTEVLAIGNARPVLGADGVLIGGVLTVRDDTERSRVEAALRETEERYRLAAHATNDAIWDWHFATNNVVWNKALEHAYGHKLVDVPHVAEWWIEHIHPQDRARIDASIHAVIDGTAHSWTDEYRFRRADGTYAVVHDRGHLIRDDAGKALRMIGAMLDLTERRRAEASLADSEERLRLATEAAEVGFWDVDVTHDVLIWPPRVNAMFGISVGVAVSMRDYYEGLHPEDRDATVEAYAAAADPARRALYDVEYRTIGKEDGVVRWVAAKGRGVFNAEGNCVRVIGTAIDITERKRLEARRMLRVQLSDCIREHEDPSELSYAAAKILGDALDASRVGYGVLNSEAETLCIERDWTAPGVVSLKGELRLRVYGSFVDQLKRGEPVVIRDAREHASITAAQAKSLEALSARSSANVPVIERGRVVAAMFVNSDRPRGWRPEEVELIRDFAGRIRTAVERTRNEVALCQLASTLEQQVEERTAERDRLWETSPDLMVVVDFKGVFRRVNPAWGALLGYAADDLVGHHVTEFVVAEDHPKTVDAYETDAVGKQLVVENRYLHKNGQTRWISWVAAPAGDVAYAIGRDVTLEKEQRAELDAAQERLRQAQKMEAVGQLTGGIAHDFNNMLAVVLGSLDLIKRRMGADDARIKRYVDAAIDGARRAALLTQRLLAFSRQQPLQPESTDVSKLVTGMSELIRGSIGSDIRFETVLAAGGWRTHADPNQLENVLLNLAVNARDAMPDGGHLTIETQNTHVDERYAAANLGVPAGQYVLIAVTDTGQGMPAEVIAKAFDPFFTTKEVGKGTGLGLSQVYGFVKQSGGNVKIYSEPGQGTTVKIYLPRLVGGEQDDAGEESVDMPLGDTKEVVLVVEDEPSVRQFSVDALCELGYRVLEADGASVALRLLDEHPEIKLLFTDVVMPEVNGRKLADEAKRRRPDLKVLFTTGYTRNAIVHNGMLDPGVALIGKPYTIEELAVKVRDVLDAPVPGAAADSAGDAV